MNLYLVINLNADFSSSYTSASWSEGLKTCGVENWQDKEYWIGLHEKLILAAITSLLSAPPPQSNSSFYFTLVPGKRPTERYILAKIVSRCQDLSHWPWISWSGWVPPKGTLVSPSEGTEVGGFPFCWLWFPSSLEKEVEWAICLTQ